MSLDSLYNIGTATVQLKGQFDHESRLKSQSQKQADEAWDALSQGV